MSSAYETAVSVFSQLANLFFWPVAVSLAFLFVWSVADLGRLLYQAWSRRRSPKTDIAGLAEVLRTHDRRRETAALSPSLRRFAGLVRTRAEMFDDDDLDLWLEEALQSEELAITAQLDRSRAFVRLGPMLGLAGTIIPLGPALQSLLGGEMGAMVNHLVVGFGAVVCGLVLSGVAYAVTLVRERWARIDLKEMENYCELVMRARRRAATKERVAHARV